MSARSMYFRESLNVSAQPVRTDIPTCRRQVHYITGSNREPRLRKCPFERGPGQRRRAMGCSDLTKYACSMGKRWASCDVFKHCLCHSQVPCSDKEQNMRSLKLSVTVVPGESSRNTVTSPSSCWSSATAWQHRLRSHCDAARSFSHPLPYGPRQFGTSQNFIPVVAGVLIPVHSRDVAPSALYIATYLPRHLQPGYTLCSSIPPSPVHR